MCLFLCWELYNTEMIYKCCIHSSSQKPTIYISIEIMVRWELTMWKNRDLNFLGLGWLRYLEAKQESRKIPVSSPIFSVHPLMIFKMTATEHFTLCVWSWCIPDILYIFIYRTGKPPCIHILLWGNKHRRQAKSKRGFCSTGPRCIMEQSILAQSS